MHVVAEVVRICLDQVVDCFKLVLFTAALTSYTSVAERLQSKNGVAGTWAGDATMFTKNRNFAHHRSCFSLMLENALRDLDSFTIIFSFTILITRPCTVKLFLYGFQLLFKVFNLLEESQALVVIFVMEDIAVLHRCSLLLF